jgi:hypothetical protein
MAADWLRDGPIKSRRLVTALDAMQQRRRVGVEQVG